MIVMTNVCKTYKNGTIALTDLNLRIKTGEFVYLVGRSGAGKSTVIRLLTQQEVITSGELLVLGRNLKQLSPDERPGLRRSLGIIFQDYQLLTRYTVFENIAYPLELSGATQDEIRLKVTEMLDFVGLAHKSQAFPDELSGGEQQRVAIARAIIHQPPLVLADEPTGNLDPKNANEIMLLLERINQLGTTIVMVTHDDKLVKGFPKKVIELKQRR